MSEAIPTLIHPHWRLCVLLIRILIIRHDVISLLSVRTAGGNRRIKATRKGITRLLFLSELQLPCPTPHPHPHACVIVWLFMFPSFPWSTSEKRQACQACFQCIITAAHSWSCTVCAYVQCEPHTICPMSWLGMRPNCQNKLFFLPLFLNFREKHHGVKRTINS